MFGFDVLQTIGIVGGAAMVAAGLGAFAALGWQAGLQVRRLRVRSPFCMVREVINER